MTAASTASTKAARSPLPKTTAAPRAAAASGSICEKQPQTAATAPGDLEELTAFFRNVGFGVVKVTSGEVHDRMIAHTSQLAHVVSNSYVKSPVSSSYSGFTGGSYKDMTRIACLNEKVWTELFLWNRDALLPEIDDLLKNITNIRNAIEAEDAKRLETLLREGREAKERIDAVNPDQPSD